jgi:hypothetical protein
VIQDTFAKGCVDSYFDEPLWRELVRFATSRGDQATVLRRFEDLKETSLDEFLEGWDRIDNEDKDPPWTILIRSGGRLATAMVTEYWVHVGGRPDLYHDSYTYSFFSNRDLSKEITSALAGVETKRWRLAPEVIVVSPDDKRNSPIAPGSFMRVLLRILNLKNS